MRVRSLQMNDASSLHDRERSRRIQPVTEMYLNYFNSLDREISDAFLTHDPAKLGQKFVDEPELWKKTEEMTRNVLKTPESTTSKCRTKRRLRAED